MSVTSKKVHTGIFPGWIERGLQWMMTAWEALLQTGKDAFWLHQNMIMSMHTFPLIHVLPYMLPVFAYSNAVVVALCFISTWVGVHRSNIESKNLIKIFDLGKLSWVALCSMLLVSVFELSKLTVASWGLFHMVQVLGGGVSPLAYGLYGLMGLTLLWTHWKSAKFYYIPFWKEWNWKACGDGDAMLHACFFIAYTHTIAMSLLPAAVMTLPVQAALLLFLIGGAMVDAMLADFIKPARVSDLRKHEHKYAVSPLLSSVQWLGLIVERMGNFFQKKCYTLVAIVCLYSAVVFFLPAAVVTVPLGMGLLLSLTGWALLAVYRSLPSPSDRTWWQTMQALFDDSLQSIHASWTAWNQKSLVHKLIIVLVAVLAVQYSIMMSFVMTQALMGLPWFPALWQQPAVISYALADKLAVYLQPGLMVLLVRSNVPVMCENLVGAYDMVCSRDPGGDAPIYYTSSLQTRDLDIYRDAL